jgi:hypothetical protein
VYDIIHAAMARDRTRELVEAANVARVARETGSPVPPRNGTSRRLMREPLLARYRRSGPAWPPLRVWHR